MFKRNKLIAVGVGIACLLALAVLPFSCAEKLKSVVGRAYSPSLRATTATNDAARAKLDAMKSRETLAAENRQLHAELERLKGQFAGWNEIAAENARLHKLLQLKQTKGLQLLAARVIGRDPSNWWKSVRIDRGATDGVAVNTAVIAPQGLVGKIVSVDPAESQVLLLVDRSCKVSGVIQTTREPGVVMGGAGEMGPNPRCRMTFISKQAKIDSKAAVVTSGMGGVFPRGLLIGTISRVGRGDAAGLYQEVEIEPAVNFKTLEEVFVVLGR
jgi:rod shape-determining protein MreC